MASQSNCLTMFDTDTFQFKDRKMGWPSDWKWADHTTCILNIFTVINEKLFENKLDPDVSIIMSEKLTVDAGRFVAAYSEWSRHKISLSAPLLTLRPRNDLINILLHQCIHFYLWTTGEDPDGAHGEHFHWKMREINKRTGLKITIHHSFTNEIFRLNLKYNGACNCNNKQVRRKKSKNVMKMNGELLCDSNDHFYMTEAFRELPELNSWLQGFTKSLKDRIKRDQLRQSKTSTIDFMDQPVGAHSSKDNRAIKKEENVENDEESTVDSGAQGSIDSDHNEQTLLNSAEPPHSQHETETI